MTHYVLRSSANSQKCLDLYTGSGTGANSNAQLYTPSETSYLTFEVGNYSDTVRIKLAGTTNNGYYLTANPGEHGERTEKSSTDVGNVYFKSTRVYDDSQEWIVHRVGTTSGGDTGNTGNENDIVIPSSKYTYYCQQDYPWVNGAYGITTTRFQDYGCPAVAATMFMQIMANNPLIKPEDLFEWGVMGNDNGYPYALWNTSGAPVNYTFYKIADDWSSAKNHIYNQLCLGKPVIIHLHEYEGTQRNGHFVLGIGMKANTTISNMTYNDIYVLDPWTSDNETLSDTMNTNPLWVNFDNVRVAV